MTVNASKTDNAHLWTRWQGQGFGWLAIAIFVTFTWLPYSYERMVSWAWIGLWQLGFLVLGIWAIWMLRQRQLPFRRLGYGLDWIVGLIAIALLLSSAFSLIPQLAIWNVTIAAGYGIWLYVLRNWLGKGGLSLNRFWIGLAGVGTVTAIVSLAIWYPRYLAGAPRNTMPLGQGNFLAGYVLLVLPLVFTWALSRQGWQRIAGLVASLVLAIDLYSTNSRGGFLGLLAVGVVATILFILRGRGKQQWQRLVGSLIVLAVVMGILLSNPRVQQLIKVASPNDTGKAVQVQLDGESWDRVFMWQANLNMVKDKPIVGVGSGNMARVYNLYRPIDVGTGASDVQQLHNTPVQILGELGLLGLSAYIALLGCLGYLWIKLYRKLSQPSDRWLLYGVGASLLAYAVSSLTDYQLENIGISSTIVALIAILVSLTDNAEGFQPYLVATTSRRWLSLGGIAALTLIFLLWLPVTWAMGLTSQGLKSLKTGNVEGVYENFSTASRLVPWDPVYSLLAGFQTLKIREGVKEKPLINELTDISLQHFESAWKASPNDPFFNHNLGVLYLQKGDISQAQVYFSRAVQLYGRIPSYSYYLLAQTYLSQKDTEKAIDTLALYGLIEPKFLTFELWSKPPLLSIREPVLAKSLKHLGTLLSEIPPQDPQYNQIYENIALLRWWDGKSVEEIDLEKLRPIAQAILLADSSPDRAKQIIEENLKTNPDDRAFLLLQAWFDPDRYLNSYLENHSRLNPATQKLLASNTLKHREMQPWLASMKQDLNNLYRNALIYPYRNLNVTRVAEVLVPQEVQSNFLVSLLGLFPPYPRSLPPLERLVDRIRTEQIDLPHPTQNRFRLERS